MPQPLNLKVKICLVGDSLVGKTSLVRRYVMDMFNDTYVSTLGTKISKKQLLIKKPSQTFRLTLSIWDVLGKHELEKTQAMAFEGAKGVILVCDFTKEDSLKNIANWISRVKEVCGEIPFLIVANKCDLQDKYAFSEAELKSFSSELNLPFFITSAKNGDNVIKIFFNLGNMVISRIFSEYT
jgi:small GTP-binding protein